MKVARDDDDVLVVVVVVVVCGKYLITRDAGFPGFCFECCISTTWIVVVVVLCGSSSGGGGGGGGVGPGICVLLFISDILFSFSHFDVRKHDGNSWVFSYQTSLLPQVFFWPLCFLDTVQKSNTTPEEHHVSIWIV